MNVLTDDELQKFLAAVEKHRDRLMFLLMADAGLRVGELVQLHIDDLVKLDKPVSALLVSGEISKSKRDRTVPLTMRTRTAIQTYIDNYVHRYNVWDLCYAFYTRTPQRHITSRQVERIVKETALHAIGRSVHPHALRHTFATRLMRTTNARIVQQLLGHKYLSTTQLYEHPNDSDLRNAIDTL